MQPSPPPWRWWPAPRKLPPPNFENDKVAPASEGLRVIAVSFTPQTKTALIEDGFQPVFEDGDKILVANGQDEPDTCVVSVKDGKATISTNLTGSLNAVYPAKAAKMGETNAKAIDGVLVSTEQDGTFASANICMAKDISEDAKEATFVNKTALFRIIPVADAQYVDVRADGYDIANDYTDGSEYTNSQLIHVAPITADTVYVSTRVPSDLTVGKLTFFDGVNEKTITGDKASTIIAVNTIYTFTIEESVTRVSLNKSSTTIFPGASETLTATNNELNWESSNDAVAIVDENGVVTGVALGTAIITATSQSNSSIKASCTVTVDNHEYVVINGLKWAKMNIGATSLYGEESYGWYFSWGNTEGYIHDGFKWVKASDGKTPLGTGGSFSTLNYNSTPGGRLTADISPSSVNDAARVNWGSNWRMPTSNEFSKMRKATYWAWDGKKKGYYVFKPGQGTQGAANGRNSIAASDTTDLALLFFPAAGYGEDTSCKNKSSQGFYWSSTIKPDMSAEDLVFLTDYINPTGGNSRYKGFLVRPVSD